MTLYVHQQKNWPRLFWNEKETGPLLTAMRHKQGRLAGRMEALGFALRSEAILETLTTDTLTSSAIEGENLNTQQVRSSIARGLQMEIAGLIPSDRHVDGVVAMTLDATQNFKAPLTRQRLFTWQKNLFPEKRKSITAVKTGAWRDDKKGPMQVVSGPYGRERVHFEAPAAAKIPHEMAVFLEWLNGHHSLDGVMKAGLAHFWFITIHPFDDGNGRIARAITDMLLARSENSAQRFYSMSAQIQKERKYYYAVLEESQKGTLDVTLWMAWFLGCLDRALDSTDARLGTILEKSRFWQRHKDTPLNPRQKNIINRLLDSFEGKLTSSKWAKICGCSQDTALRDIDDLLNKKILAKEPAGGRSTSYALVTITPTQP